MDWTGVQLSAIYVYMLVVVNTSTRIKECNVVSHSKNSKYLRKCLTRSNTLTTNQSYEAAKRGQLFLFLSQLNNMLVGDKATQLVSECNY